MKRKTNGRGKAVALQVFFVLAIICQADATVVDVCDGIFTISDGDNYDIVNIWDNATVNMDGGQVSSLFTYELGTLLYYGGDIHDIWVHNDSIAYIETDFCQAFEIYDYGQIHMDNGPIGASIQIFDDSELHIYGYGLYYIPGGTGEVKGSWEDGRNFGLYIRNAGEIVPEDHIFLHEIPEPATIAFLGFGLYLLSAVSA
jgi:hypothetical protein